MADQGDTGSVVSSGPRWGKWRYAFGLLMLLGVVAIWVASAELMKVSKMEDLLVIACAAYLSILYTHMLY